MTAVPRTIQDEPPDAGFMVILSAWIPRPVGTVEIVEDLLEIDVAAEVASLRMVRLVTIDAAERAGLDCDACDDLRIGVEELCLAAVAAAPFDGAGGRLSLRFRVSSGSVIVHGTARLGDDRVEVGLSRIGASILAVVADEHELLDADGVVRFVLVKHKVVLEAVSS